MAFACGTAVPAHAQTIYQYTDKQGAVVLTDKPPAGVKTRAFVTAEPAPKLPVEKSVPAGQVPPPGSMTAEEALRQRDQKLDELRNEVQARERDREAERQRRFQEADKLDAEARQPVSATRENRQRQYELQREAEKLRRAE